jgi:superoxide dismutase, Fe-Mn family
VPDADKLKLMKTDNAKTPLTKGLQPLLRIDVWENAHHLDYQDRRADYFNAVLDKVIPGDLASHNPVRALAAQLLDESA